MIIPMYHAADEAAHGKRDPNDMQREFDEMTKYRHSLQNMLGSKGLGAICWEVNRTGIRHFHWQLIACDPAKIKTGMIEAAYKIAAETYKIKSQDENGQSLESPTKFTPCDPNQLLSGQRSDFFRVWIWHPTEEQPSSSPSQSKPDTNQSPIAQADAISNGHDSQSPPRPAIPGIEKSMFFPIPSSMSFNISFGREVMAGILQLEQRSDWRTIKSGDGIEAADAQAWQEEYQQPGWDFAMA